MEPKPTGDPIYDGLICQYCGSPTVYVDSKIIYGTSYGMIYFCQPCDAYTGTHAGTNVAYGSVANIELRASRKEAHRHFDKLWMGRNKYFTRSKAYAFMGGKLAIEKKFMHIGMLNIEQCKKLIFHCCELHRSKNRTMLKWKQELQNGTR